MTETILVTGSEGFIGKYLVSRLQRDGNKVISFSRTLGNNLLLEDPFHKFLGQGIETVFHLAAHSINSESWDNPNIFYQSNTLGTQKVLEFCRKTGTRLIYLSSYIYGKPRYLPVDETHPANPHSPYTHSKWLGEEICRFYAQNFQVPCSIIRPFNIYGPSQSDRFLIPHIISDFQKFKVINVENLESRRDFLFISDLVEALIAVYCQKRPFEIYNVGYGQSYSVAEIIQQLEQIVGQKITIHNSNRLRRGEILEITAGSRLIKERLWNPRISLSEGLQMILETFS